MMAEERPDEIGERERPARERTTPENEEHPAPEIKHAPEPSAENIMPAEDRPGTL